MELRLKKEIDGFYELLDENNETVFGMHSDQLDQEDCFSRQEIEEYMIKRYEAITID